MRIELSGHLTDDELIIYEAHTTKIGLLASWVSIPAFLTLNWLVVYFPTWIKARISSSFRQMILSEFDLEDISDFDIKEYIFQNIFGDSILADFVSIMVTISIILLISVWLTGAIIMTQKYNNNAMVITDRRIFCHSGDKDLTVSFEELSQIYMNQTLCGKIFHYGDILLQTRKSAITVKNLESSDKIYKIIDKHMA